MTASFIARGLAAVVAFTSYTASFQLPHSTSLHLLSQQQRRLLSSSLPTSSLHSENNPREQQEDIIASDLDLIGSIPESTSSIDWDAEWKKVLENKEQPPNRLVGNDDRSELEIRAVAAKKKAERAVARNVFDASESMKRSADRMPTWRSLQGDWKVCNNYRRAIYTRCMLIMRAVFYYHFLIICQLTITTFCSYYNSSG